MTAEKKFVIEIVRTEDGLKQVVKDASLSPHDMIFACAECLPLLIRDVAYMTSDIIDDEEIYHRILDNAISVLEKDAEVPMAHVITQEE